VTSSPTDPKQEPLDTGLLRDQADLDASDDRELARRAAEAGRVRGAQA
jgi:hypothetical protein